MSSDSRSRIVLGWRTNRSLEPEYWTSLTNARPGAQSNDDLVTFSPALLAAHTAIIAQSGSGKSFFLGRLIEEIAIKTRSRVTIFDPNSDFRRIANIESKIWKEAGYNKKTGLGYLPTESSMKEFEKYWPQDWFHIIGRESLQFWWPAIPVWLLAEGLDVLRRNSFELLHGFIARLILAQPDRDLPIEIAEKIVRKFRESDNDVSAVLMEAIPSRAFESRLLRADGLFTSHGSRDNLLESAKLIRRMPAETVDFYFSKYRELKKHGCLASTEEESVQSLSLASRLRVLDMPALEEELRLLSVFYLLDETWREARRKWNEAINSSADKDERAPHFIVIDEAHNLVPAHAATGLPSLIRDRVRQIAAEGRKYGLFLIMVSQRPDKLDDVVLSECDNRAIMRLGSKTVLGETKQLLGLDDLPDNVVTRVLEFQAGRGLLVGRWSPDAPTFFVAAARRTVEGGRNLRDRAWALPPKLVSDSGRGAKKAAASPTRAKKNK